MNTKFKIRVIVNGADLVYNACVILDEDISFVRFSDKFGTIFRFNKATIVSMEEIR